MNLTDQEAIKLWKRIAEFGALTAKLGRRIHRLKVQNCRLREELHAQRRMSRVGEKT